MSTNQSGPEITSLSTDHCCCGTSVNVRLEDGTERHWGRRQVHLTGYAGEEVPQVWDSEEGDEELVAKVNDRLVRQTREERRERAAIARLSET
jgi:hypothetical protein